MMAQTDPTQMLPVGYTLAGRYRIERYISSGGFGNTYLARDINLDAVVAVKEFFMQGDTHRATDRVTVSVSNPAKGQLFKEQLRKFNTEARRIRSLQSDHIVRVTDLLQANGTSYYVMDYIQGETLAGKLQRTHGALPEQEIWQILHQLLDALDTVHRAGLFHLDLKPANIMVNQAGKVVLIDFGASKQISASGDGATNSTALCYTPGYAPTEQIDQQADKIGAWTDIYALGATLYKLATNEHPPLPSNLMNEGTSAFHFGPGVSHPLRQLITLMMHPALSQRPPSIAAVRGVVSSMLQHPHTPGMPGQAYHPGQTVTQSQQNPYPSQAADIKRPFTSSKAFRSIIVFIIFIAQIYFALAIRTSLKHRHLRLDSDGWWSLGIFAVVTLLLLALIYDRNKWVVKFWNVMKWGSLVGCFANSFLLKIWNGSLTDAFFGLSICLALISSFMFLLPKDKK